MQSLSIEKFAAAETIKTKSILQKIEILLNAVNHVFVGFITIYLTWLVYKTGAGKTSLHAWLCVSGYQLLMAESILLFYTENTWSSIFSRESRKTFHWILQTAGSILAISGISVKFVDKGFSIHSIHSILGLTSGILLIFSLTAGLSALYAKNLRNYLSPAFNKFAHNLIGLACFVIGMSSLYFGYDTGFMRRNVDADFRILMKIISLVTIFLSSGGAVGSLRRNLQAVLQN